MKTNIEYHIFNPRDIAYTEELEIRNQSFTSWFNLWSSVYAKAGSDYKLKPEEFVRQNLVTAILVDQKVAALHLYSFYMLDSLADLRTHYFEFFSEEYIRKIKIRGVEKVMSMEFLTVLPEYQKSQIGISLGRVISSLGTKIFELSHVDAIVAPARRDVKVHEMAYDIGFDCIQSSVVHRGFECDMVACFQGKQKDSESIEVRQMTQILWNQKVIHGSAKYHFESQNKIVKKLTAAA